jgi:hypothetical protein
MEEICSSETSVTSQQTTRRHIPEDDTLHGNQCFGSIEGKGSPAHLSDYQRWGGDVDRVYLFIYLFMLLTALSVFQSI